MAANRSRIPIAFKKDVEDKSYSITVLAGDVGGTKTNMALYRLEKGEATILNQKRYPSKDFKSLDEVVHDFIGDKRPDHFCAAVAGPVLHGKSKLTNLSWTLDSEAMSASLGCAVAFINDLEATAYGLAGLKENERALIAPGEPGAQGNIAILAPGTGLGEAGLFWDGKAYHPFATEGGHSDFGPRTDLDIEVFKWLRQQFGHVSWERVVSGTGIKNLYKFFTEAKNAPVPDWLKKRMETEDLAAVISGAALKKEDPLCAEVMDLFVRYLATEASCLIMKLMATGGLYLGGGIPPKILPLIQNENWEKNFDNNGRMHELADKVPVYAILNDKMALLGAAYYAAFNM
jgi:glucokinase